MDIELNFAEGVGLNYATPLYWNGPDAYENATSRALAMLAGRSKLFLDVGSNIGIYAVYAGVRFPGLEIHAFEPVPAIWEKNRRFHQGNGLSVENVHKLGVSDAVEISKMYMPVYDWGLEEEQTATVQADSWQVHEKKVVTFAIECTTVDRFAAGRRLAEGPCCMKIDVENAEARVLRGAREFIHNRRPWIMCEILPTTELDSETGGSRVNNRETVAMIEELHYAAFAVTENGFFRMNPADFSQLRNLKDFLLVPREKIEPDVLYLTPENAARKFVE